MENVKTYNQMKSAVWNCVIDSSESDSNLHYVELLLLRDLLKEIKVYIDYFDLDIKHEIRT